MMTLKRLRVLAESYGADLQRWPPDIREQARQLADNSSEARTLLEEAGRLDSMIEAARRHHDARRWPQSESEAALTRLRSGVAARIAATPPAANAARRRRFDWLSLGFAGRSSAPGLRRLGLATGCVCAIIAGLLIGTLSGSAPAPAGVLSMLLRPAALEILPE